MTNRISLPQIMEIGRGALSRTPDVLKTLGVRKPMIVTDRTMIELDYVESLRVSLASVGMESKVFSETIPEPTAASIEAGVNMLRDGNFDSIIALGGGSPIDSAKAISIVGKYGGHIRDYKYPRDVEEHGLPIIAIPTTSGTGSEATRFTIITDESSDEKMLCAGIGFMPVAAIIDHSLTLTLPARTTADCGLDALTHAIEAYVSRRANAFSDSQALIAMKLIGKNLRTAFNSPANENARESMMLGSTLAGIAFSNSSVALVHGMSRPIGALFHIPHGLSNAMLLPAITEFSIKGNEKRYADCARAIGVATNKDSDQTACDQLVAELHLLNKDLKVPTLKEYGIEGKNFISSIPVMAKQALASGSPANNPRSASAQEIADLYKAVWQLGATQPDAIYCVNNE